MFSRSTVLVFLAVLVSTIQANAVTRAIMIPGKTAILIMEGMSSSGPDLDPRRLYDAIAMPAIQRPDGQGKILKSSGKDFNFACVTKNSSQVSVVCNIAINSSANAQVSGSDARFRATAADSQDFYQKLLGASATLPFHFETLDHRLRIEATREMFEFYFHQ